MTQKTLLDISLDVDSWSLCKNKNQIILSIKKLYENDDDFMLCVDSLLENFNNENEIKITILDILNKKVPSEKIELVNEFFNKILNNFNVSIKLNNGVSLKLECEINNIQNAAITIIGNNRLDDINLRELSESIKQIIIELKENVERLLNRKMAENINFEEIEKFIDNLSHKMQKKFLQNLHEEASKISILSREMGCYIIPGQLKNILLMYNKLNFQEKTRLYNNFRYVLVSSGTQKLHIETIRCIIKLFKNHIDLLDKLLFIENFNKPKPTIVDENPKPTIVDEEPETVIVDENPENVVVDENPIPNTPEKRVIENIKLTDYVKYMNAAIRGSLKNAIRKELINESDLHQYEVKTEDFTLTNGNDFLTKMDIKNHVKKIKGIKLGFDTDKGTKSLKTRWRNVLSIIDPTTFFYFYLTVVNKSK